MCFKIIIYYLKVKSLIVWFFHVQLLSPSFIISYTPNLSNKRYKIPNSHAVLLNIGSVKFILMPIFYIRYVSIHNHLPSSLFFIYSQL